MISDNGKVKKKTYCPGCFSILTWDDPTDEFTLNGHRAIICPICGAKVDLCPPQKVKIVEGE